MIRKFHCVKSVRIRSYSGPHFPAFGLNKNCEYKHFSRNDYKIAFDKIQVKKLNKLKYILDV